MLNVFPSMALCDGQYGALGNPISPPEFGQRVTGLHPKPSNFTNQFWIQFSSTVMLPIRPLASSLFVAILVVFNTSSYKKMLGVAARWIITAMKHTIVRFGIITGKHHGNSVSKIVGFAQSKFAVSTGVFTRHPRPAFVWPLNVHLFPKSLSKRFSPFFPHLNRLFLILFPSSHSSSMLLNNKEVST